MTSMGCGLSDSCLGLSEMRERERVAAATAEDSSEVETDGKSADARKSWRVKGKESLEVFVYWDIVLGSSACTSMLW